MIGWCTWNNGKSEALWCVAEFPKMVSSTTWWCSRHETAVLSNCCPPISAPHTASQPMKVDQQCSVDGVMGRHMGRHCVVDKIVSYLGPDFPLFYGGVSLLLSSTITSFSGKVASPTITRKGIIAQIVANKVPNGPRGSLKKMRTSTGRQMLNMVRVRRPHLPPSPALLLFPAFAVKLETKAKRRKWLKLEYLKTWILENLNTWIFLYFHVGSSILLEFFKL